MKYIKKNIILSFGIGLLFISIGCGVFGYFLTSSIEKQYDDANLNWSYPLTSEYESIEVKDGKFVGYKEMDFPSAPDTLMEFTLDPDGEFTSAKKADVFPNGLLYHKDRGEYGAITDQGDIIVKAQYDHIFGYGEYILGGTRKFAYDLYTKDGELILSTGEEGTISHIEGDLFFVADGERFLFDGKTREKMVLDYAYDTIVSNDNGGYWGMNSSRFFKLDKDFMPIYDDIQYQHFEELSEGLRYVEIYNPEDSYSPRCAYINQDEEIVIDFGYGTVECAAPFSEGKALIQKGYRLYCIDTSGRTLFQIEDRLSANAYNTESMFHDGYAAVSLDSDAYGYINEKGNFVIPPILTAASEVIDGHAAVSLNGVTYGIISLEDGGGTDVK